MIDVILAGILFKATDKRGPEPKANTDEFMSWRYKHLYITSFHGLIVIVDQLNIKIIIMKVTEKLAEKLFCIKSAPDTGSRHATNEIVFSTRYAVFFNGSFVVMLI